MSDYLKTQISIDKQKMNALFNQDQHSNLFKVNQKLDNDKVDSPLKVKQTPNKLQHSFNSTNGNNSDVDIFQQQQLDSKKYIPNVQTENSFEGKIKDKIKTNKEKSTIKFQNSQQNLKLKPDLQFIQQSYTRINPEPEQKANVFQMMIRQQQLQKIAQKIMSFYVRNINNLGKYYLNIINDLSYDNESQGYRKIKRKQSKKFKFFKFNNPQLKSMTPNKSQTLNPFFKKYQKQISFLKQKLMLPVQDPNNNFSTIFDIISYFITVFWIIVFSLTIGLQVDIDNVPMNIIRFISFTFYLGEIYTRFHIGIYYKGNTIMQRSLILQHYKKLIPYDIISSLVLFINFFTNQYNLVNVIIQMIFYVKYIPFQTISKSIKRRQQLKREESYIQKLLQMLFQIVLISHWLGILWHLIAYVEIQYGEQNTWLQGLDLVDQTWQVKYIYSFYSALATCLLIGAGGSTPVEQVFIIIFLFGTVGVFAYILSSISLLIEEINKKSYEYKHDMELINTYMRKNNIEKKTQTKIRSYLEYVYQDREKMKQNIAVVEVLEKLPKYMNDEIISEINIKILQKIHFLKSTFSYSTLKNLSQIIQEENHVTNNIIIDSNQKCTLQNNYLYIIKSGQVDICFKDQNQKLVKVSQLKQQQLFGDIRFITGIKQENITVKASSFVTLLKIERNNFIKILRGNQTDYEKFMYMQQQILNEGVTNLYTRNCVLCQSEFHTEQNCRILCYKPYKMLSLLKHQRLDWIIQERKRYFRPKSKQQKSILLQSQMQQLSQQIQTIQKFQYFLEGYDNYLLINNNYIQDTENEEKLSQYHSFISPNFKNDKIDFDQQISQSNQEQRNRNYSQQRHSITSQIQSQMQFLNSQNSLSNISEDNNSINLNDKNNNNKNISNKPLQKQPIKVKLSSQSNQNKRSYSQLNQIFSSQDFQQQSDFFVYQGNNFQSNYNQHLHSLTHNNNNNNNTNNATSQQNKPNDLSNAQKNTLYCFDMEEKFYNFQIYYPQYNFKNVYKKLQQKLQQILKNKKVVSCQTNKINRSNQFDKRKTFKVMERSLYNVQMKKQESQIYSGNYFDESDQSQSK